MTVKKKKIIPEDRRAGGAGSKGGCAVVPLDLLLAREGRMRLDIYIYTCIHTYIYIYIHYLFIYIFVCVCIPEDGWPRRAGSEGGCAVVPLDVLLAREGRMRRDGGEGFAGLLEPH